MGINDENSKYLIVNGEIFQKDDEGRVLDQNGQPLTGYAGTIYYKDGERSSFAESLESVSQEATDKLAALSSQKASAEDLQNDNNHLTGFVKDENDQWIYMISGVPAQGEYMIDGKKIKFTKGKVSNS